MRGQGCRIEAAYWGWSLAVLFLMGAGVCPVWAGEPVWIHGGFEEFAKGQFEDGGSNLYVNAEGVIEMIHRWDVNDDGYVDLVLANSHDYVERGPTHVYRLSRDRKRVRRQEMSADSGWMSRVIDLDEDGFTDLIVANGENGVTSELPSFVYWGGPQGLGAERTDLPTVGAYDFAVLDIDGDHRLDLIFPSAWHDHHNPGKPLLARVFVAGEKRQFKDLSERYAIEGVAAVSIAAADLNRDGHDDLVLANYRVEHDYNTESYVYWGSSRGLETQQALRLPTFSPLRVVVADLNQDDWSEVLFSGGNRVQIYWNREGKLSPEDTQIIEVTGYSSMFSQGAVGLDVADLNADGHHDLALGANEGIEIRLGPDFQKVNSRLPLTHVDWVTAQDLDADGSVDLVVSRYDDGVLYDTQSAVFWNGASGFSMDRATWFPTGGAVGNTAGDLDGDGRPEVIFNNTMSGHLCKIHNYIYLGNKDAEYSVDRRLELPTDSSTMGFLADLNLDGFPEFGVDAGVKTPTGWRSVIRIHRGTSQGPSPTEITEIPANPGLQHMAVADFNRDGYLDILAIAQVYDTKPETLAKSGTIYYGSRDGFSPDHSEGLEVYGNSGGVADVNKDGYLDVLCNDKRDYVRIYLGSTEGFSKQNVWKVPVPAAGRLNVADLNKDGWLDLIVSCSGHYRRLRDTMHILYGSPEGYRASDSQALLAGYTGLATAVADYNRDGNLDILQTAYSSPTARVLPARLFWGNGKRIDLENPLMLPAEAASDATQVDLDRDGWIDIVLACHRNDIGHQVDSLIYWNGPQGFSTDRVTRLPGLGPHGMVVRDRGNAYTRKPEESYLSPPLPIEDLEAGRLHWKAEVKAPAELKFQLRWAGEREALEKAGWMGPTGEDSYFEQSGQTVQSPPRGARWVQYRALFISPYGCRTPRLREVRFEAVPETAHLGAVTKHVP